VIFFIAAVVASALFVTVYLVGSQWHPQAIGLALSIVTMSAPFSQVPPRRGGP
jgi:hypothetical protein